VALEKNKTSNLLTKKKRKSSENSDQEQCEGERGKIKSRARTKSGSFKKTRKTLQARIVIKEGKKKLGAVSWAREKGGERGKGTMGKIINWSERNVVKRAESDFQEDADLCRV